MSEWQPIETAPKDGTEIFLFGQYGHFWSTPLASHFADCPFTIIVGHRISDPESVIYAAGWQNPEYETFILPTHWMPLHPPPEKQI